MRQISVLLLLCIILTWSISFGIMLAPIKEWRYIQRPGRSYEVTVTPEGPMLHVPLQRVD